MRVFYDLGKAFAIRAKYARDNCCKKSLGRIVNVFESKEGIVLIGTCIICDKEIRETVRRMRVGRHIGSYRIQRKVCPA